MNGPRLLALSECELRRLCSDCGLADPGAGTFPTAAVGRGVVGAKALLVSRLLSLQSEAQKDEGVDLVLSGALLEQVSKASGARSKASRPTAAAPAPAPPCAVCGWRALRGSCSNDDGLCACGFVALDPVRPPEEVLVLEILTAATPKAQWKSRRGSRRNCWRDLPPRPHARSEVDLRWPSLAHGEALELRMAQLPASEYERGVQHCWPRALKVCLDGCELFRLDAPETEAQQQHPPRRTSHVPLEILRADNQRAIAEGATTEVMTSDQRLCHRGRLTIEAELSDVRRDPGDPATTTSDFVFCVVRVGPALGPQDLFTRCAPDVDLRVITAAETAELWASLGGRLARDGDEDGAASAAVECSSPWSQPLVCPLTCERLKIPVRARACRHLRCFDFEAYLVTATRTAAFSRRWRCPCCGIRLLPSDLARCEFTTRLLNGVASSTDTDAVPLEPALEAALSSISRPSVPTLAGTAMDHADGRSASAGRASGNPSLASPTRNGFAQSRGCLSPQGHARCRWRYGVLLQPEGSPREASDTQLLGEAAAATVAGGTTPISAQHHRGSAVWGRRLRNLSAATPTAQRTGLPVNTPSPISEPPPSARRVLWPSATSGGPSAPACPLPSVPGDTKKPGTASLVWDLD